MYIHTAKFQEVGLTVGQIFQLYVPHFRRFSLWPAPAITTQRHGHDPVDVRQHKRHSHPFKHKRLELIRINYEGIERFSLLLITDFFL